MLSKNNKILIGCLALLLVMSVGYALFSDTIEINGSATAKGEFELTTVCNDDTSSTALAVNSGSVSDVKISCNGNIVNASAALDYPGSVKTFEVMVTNTGTIPAKLKKVVELNNPDEMIVEKDNVREMYKVVTNEDNTNQVLVSLYPGNEWQLDYEEEYEVAPSWDEGQFDAVLDPGETAYFYIEMRWAERSSTSREPLTASINAEITWEQVTE